MKVQLDFLPKLKTQTFKDETLSYSGKSDFTKEEPEIKTFGPYTTRPRPRTKASELNSYS